MTASFIESFAVKSEYDLRERDDDVKTLIPRLLHLIWVGENAEPDFLAHHIAKWKELMPEWTVRVWGNADIHEGEFPPEAVAIINASTKGVQKADIMKYFITLKHGGVYMDADVIPHRALEPCLANSTVVLCHDLEVTWSYMAVGFMAAIPNHPLFQKCCNFLLCAELNTPDIHLKTGPRILGMALEVNPEPPASIALLPIQSFYRNDQYPLRFGTHTYARMWS